MAIVQDDRAEAVIDAIDRALVRIQSCLRHDVVIGVRRDQIGQVHQAGLALEEAADDALLHINDIGRADAGDNGALQVVIKLPIGDLFHHDADMGGDFLVVGFNAFVEIGEEGAKGPDRQRNLFLRRSRAGADEQAQKQQNGNKNTDMAFHDCYSSRKFLRFFDGRTAGCPYTLLLLALLCTQSLLARPDIC